VRSAEQSLQLVAATVGFISFFLLWLTVIWGMILRNGWALTWVRHTTLLATHTTVALVGLTLGAVHAGAQMVKPGNLFRLVDILVPFAFWRDPIGTGVGVLGLEILIAVAASIVIQRWLGHNRWRALHTLAYVAFTLIVAHILISGADLADPRLLWSVIGAWVLTVVVWFVTTPMFALFRRTVTGHQPGPVRQRLQDVTVNVDAQRCARFGFCEHEAPQVFRLRSDGRLAYRASVPADEAEPVVRAAEVCPARAIMLSRVPHALGSRPSEPPVSPGPYYGPPAGAGERRRRTPRYRD
jgi:ferredoxin